MLDTKHCFMCLKEVLIIHVYILGGGGGGGGASVAQLDVPRDIRVLRTHF